MVFEVIVYISGKRASEENILLDFLYHCAILLV